MSSIKNPVTKNAKRLKKDHRVYTFAGNKTFRGVWKKKKRRLGKKERRATGNKLAAVDLGSVEDADSPKRQVSKRIRKGGVVTLERALDIKKNDPMKRFSLFSYSSRTYEKRA
ncbi:MAG: hypothetical protein V4675_23470 [Verrucomicrobiota bacterium]